MSNTANTYTEIYALTTKEAYEKFENNFLYDGRAKVYMAHVNVEDTRNRTGVEFIAPCEVVMVKRVGQYNDTYYVLQDRLGDLIEHSKERIYQFSTNWQEINNKYYDLVNEWEDLQIELEKKAVDNRAVAFAKFLEVNNNKLVGVTTD